MSKSRDSRVASQAKRDAKLRAIYGAINRVEFVARWADAEYEAVLRETARRLRFSDDEEKEECDD
jgi:hypothetical protein